MKPRPPFMITLGLVPPVTEEDAKRAYLEKVKVAHPDHGGTRDQFTAVQDAYRHAQEYVRLRGDRRGWIRARVDHYLEIERLSDKLDGLGAEVESDVVDWLNQSFGDFAALTSEVHGIRLEKSAAADQLVDLLVTDRNSLRGLKRLALTGCQVSDGAVLRLSALPNLTHLDLTGTGVSSRVLELIPSLPQLELLELAGTRVGWWARLRARRQIARQQRESSQRDILRSLGRI